MMLSEADYIEKIKSLLPKEGDVTVEVLEMMEKALVGILRMPNFGVGEVT